MRRAFSLWILLAPASFAAGSEWLVEGGTITPGGHLTVDRLVIGSQARLAGSGDITGNLSFSSGSGWRVEVRGDEDVDFLRVGGTVTGSTQIEVIAEPGAIPLTQPILQAAPISSLGGVTADDSATWRLDHPGPGLLTLTLPGGDRDADGLPR